MDNSLLSKIKYSQAWKWLSAPWRANALQVRMMQRQEARLKPEAVADVAARVGLSKAPVVSLSPTTKDNFNYMRAEFPNIVTNDRPVSGLHMVVGRREVKPTDAVLHEMGHIKTIEDGKLTPEKAMGKYSESPFTVIRRLVDPDSAKMVQYENMADQAAFADKATGKLSRFGQLRHHPAIAGYRGFSRIGAGVQGASLLALAAYGGKYAYDILKEKEEQ